MVMNTETKDSKDLSRNGKKSSSNNSPLTNSEQKNKHFISEDLTPEVSSDDDSNSKKNLNSKPKNKSEFEEKIRVGKDYQAVVPEFNPKNDVAIEKALLVWSPNSKDIPDSKIEEYIQLAKERYGYNAEQALGMLYWHKHDLAKAVIDLANFTPFPEEWSKEDKVLFEQAFQFHGKCFHRIRQMLPDKSIASLVKFYYSWKKTRSRTSVMDRQEKRKNEGGSENGSDDTPDNSDVEDKIDSDDDNKSEQQNSNENADEVINVNGTKRDEESMKVQSKANIVVVTTSTSKPLKRKIENDDDDCIIESPEKKFAPLLADKSEISITPIRKPSAEDKQNATVA